MTDDELLSRFKFTELTEEVLAECEHFSCGIDDLDEYFQKDVVGYTRRMVNRSYVFRSNSNPNSIGGFNPTSWRKRESIQTSLFSKPLEL